MTKVTCGWRHSLAVLASGALYSFGWCKYGQLGHGDNNDQWLPRRLATLDEPVQSAAGGWRHTAVVTASGRMYCWGWNRFGQARGLPSGAGLHASSDRGSCVVLCLRPNPSPASPSQVGNASFEDTNGPGAPLFFPGAPGAAVVQSMTCGWRHTLAVLAGGGVYSWGRGASGQARAAPRASTLHAVSRARLKLQPSPVSSPSPPADGSVSPSQRPPLAAREQLGHGNTECHNRPQLIDAFGPPAGAAAAASPDAASAAPVWAVPTGADARKAAGSEQDVATVPTVRRGEKDALVPDRPEVDAGVGASLVLRPSLTRRLASEPHCLAAAPCPERAASTAKSVRSGSFGFPLIIEDEREGLLPDRAVSTLS